jgi:IQ calmodulin-binding motif
MCQADKKSHKNRYRPNLSNCNFFKVFLKYFHVDHLSKLFKNLTDAVTVVQAMVRGWMARKHYGNYCRLRNHCARIIQTGSSDILLEEKAVTKMETLFYFSISWLSSSKAI